jgi:hypothetical protein
LIDLLLPVLGFDAVNLDGGAAVLAKESESGEGEAIALFGGKDVESLCLDIVCLEAKAKLETKGKDALSLKMAELGCKTVVFDGRGLVLGMSVAAKEELLGEVKELLCFAKVLGGVRGGLRGGGGV